MKEAQVMFRIKDQHVQRPKGRNKNHSQVRNFLKEAQVQLTIGWSWEEKGGYKARSKQR